MSHSPAEKEKIVRSLCSPETMKLLFETFVLATIPLEDRNPKVNHFGVGIDRQLALVVLDSLGFLGHGGNISGSYVWDKGYDVEDAIRDALGQMG